MNQTKIGKFISTIRKEKGLTQKEIADKLDISDKTVSKWETGKGLPEVSMMLPLCDILGITVNELLCGERLSDTEYKQEAEKKMIDLMTEKKNSKKRIFIEIVVIIISLLSSLTIIEISAFLEMQDWLRVILLIIGIIVISGGIVVAIALELDTGTYECSHCHTRFAPAATEFISGPHTLTTRYLKCPECGKKGFCKQRLTH